MFGQRRTTESNGRSANLWGLEKESVFKSVLTPLPWWKHAINMGPRVKKKKKKRNLNKNNISQTCTICLWVCCWHLLHNPSIFKKKRNRATTHRRHRPYRTTKCYNSSGLGSHPAAARPPARHVSSITPSHQLHTALIFDKQNCNFLLMYVGCLFLFFSVLKEKETCETLWKSRDVLFFFLFLFFFALQTLTSLLYFFLLEKSSWLLYIVMMLIMTMITYLLAVQGALLPACVCMKGVTTVWPNGGGCDEDNDDDDIGSVCVYCYNVECFFSLLSMRDSWETCACGCLLTCVCLCALAFEHLSAPVREVNRC